MTYTADSSAIDLQSLEDVTGKGLVARYEGDSWKIGKAGFVVDSLVSPLSAGLLAQIDEAESTGKTLVYVSQNDVLAAIFMVEDSLKPESKLLISQLKEMGVTPILLTGDQEKTARYVASQVGIDRVIANCLPTDKVLLSKNYKPSLRLSAWSETASTTLLPLPKPMSAMLWEAERTSLWSQLTSYSWKT